MSGAAIHEAICDALEGGGLGLTRSPVPFAIDAIPEYLAGRVFSLRADEADTDGDIGGSAMVVRSWTCAIHYRLTQEPNGGLQSAITTTEAVLAVLHSDPLGVSRSDVGRVVWAYPLDGQHAIAEIPFTTSSYEAV